MMLSTRSGRRLLTKKRILSTLVLGLVPTLLLAISSSPVAAAQSTVKVSINNFSFTPANITVVLGINNTVMWTQNQAGIPYHTVTANDNSWGSGHLTEGQNFTYTFTTPGTYGYHCTLHTYMKGTVIVLAGPSSSTATTSSTTSSNAVPEFPFQAIAVVVITMIAVVAYAALRYSHHN